MKKFKGDRRTKQGKTDYEQWKKNHSEASKGLGDSVEAVLKATGVDRVAKWMLGEDCGCDERKSKLNYLFPNYRPNCLTEDEYNYLEERVGKLNTVTIEEQKALLSIYNRVFNDRRELTGCNSCFLNGVWKKLERVFNEYK